MCRHDYSVRNATFGSTSGIASSLKYEGTAAGFLFPMENVTLHVDTADNTTQVKL